MPNEIKRILLQKLMLRYRKSSRRQKTLILDEYCATTEISRKHAIRLLNGEIKSHREHPGPKYKYGDDVRKHVVILWGKFSRVCSKKMVVEIKLWLPFYEGISDDTRYLLTQISSSTIDRILSGVFIPSATSEARRVHKLLLFVLLKAISEGVL